MSKEVKIDINSIYDKFLSTVSWLVMPLTLLMFVPINLGWLDNWSDTWKVLFGLCPIILIVLTGIILGIMSKLDKEK